MLWPGMQALTRREWHGAEHLGSPGDGMVLAVNHISWFDPFVMCHFINDNGRSVRILAKSGLFDVPLGGRLLKATSQILVHRGTGDAAAALDAAVDAVNDGECVLLYPEGTITRDPDLWPMTGKTGAARIALRTRRPVVPAAQWGAQAVMGPYRLEAHLLPLKTMHVTAGEPVDLSDLYDLEPTPAVLEVATNRIMREITRLLSEIRGEAAPDGQWNLKAACRQPLGPTELPPAPKRARTAPAQRGRSSRTGASHRTTPRPIVEASGGD